MFLVMKSYAILNHILVKKELTMACEYICDGCGKREPADFNGREWTKPSSWYQRSDEDGIQDACCRECIEIVSKKTGKTSVVLPA